MMKILKLRYASLLCAAIGFGMMIFGAIRGELSIVFTQAINICLECIGIG